MSEPKPPSSRIFWIVVVVLGLAVVLGAAVGASNIARGPVIETLRAARLAPLPKSAINVTSTAGSDGGSYSVQVRFAASASDIDAWIQRSPSARLVKPVQSSAGTRQYTLPSSPDAQASSVTVDDARGTVQIDLQRT